MFYCTFQTLTIICSIYESTIIIIIKYYAFKLIQINFLFNNCNIKSIQININYAKLNLLLNEKYFQILGIPSFTYRLIENLWSFIKKKLKWVEVLIKRIDYWWRMNYELFDPYFQTKEFLKSSWIQYWDQKISNLCNIEIKSTNILYVGVNLV